MIEEQATVIDREGDYVWVQTHRQSSCGHCSAKNTCGTQVLSKVLGNKTAQVRCWNSKDVKIGDQVIIGIEESALLGGSLLVYFLPLISMIIFGAVSVFLSKAWWPDDVDLWSVIASVSGLLLGLVFTNYHTQKINQRKRYEPILLKKLNPNDGEKKPVLWNHS